MSVDNRPWLIFDYDDTLGGVQIGGTVQGNDVAYDRAIESFANYMEALEFDRAEAIAIQANTDQHLCRQHGFADINRFAESMVRTYKALASKKNLPVDDTVVEVARSMGMSVFSYRYMPLPGALFTLAALKPSYRISVVTKGQDAEQRKKASVSGIELFADSIQVVSYKNEAEWAMVLDLLGIKQSQYESTWAIGNSPKSDVNVPLRMGLNAIHVNQGGWAFEQEDFATPVEGRQLIKVDRIDQVLDHLQWS